MQSRLFGSTSVAQKQNVLPLDHYWRRHSKYDWTSVREEVFKDVDQTPAGPYYKDDDVYDHEGRMPDQYPSKIMQSEARTFIPQADGFPEAQKLSEDDDAIKTLTFQPGETEFEKEKLPPTPPKVAQSNYRNGKSSGAGRRKRAKANALLAKGQGKITVNGRPFGEYFKSFRDRDIVVQPLVTTETVGDFDVDLRIHGGGIKGQSDAARLAVARALVGWHPDYRLVLRTAGLLHRDTRVVERKKTGLKKARKAPQW
eukprot:CAMPEP_0201551970 /NCGR_PEP_ID=MMETSP0173_2-20130828/12174_1 /ASSEMBLY_ACC=CAM_ASM_000268 /TAXON_ID=218659 /ORGANISM="Vexillifera sp., Strain DIVA3 564/2" /LENGTH=255 /DNA_ID=CAMNT_0047962349 /DNA_START=46 /DNA_END=810 /DNA_ORIENTATION=+